MTDDKKLNSSISLASKIIFIIILLVTLTGFSIAIHLSFIHYNTHTNPSYHSTCAINEKINCESVAQSPYSIFMGLPISIWGLIAYSLVAVLAIWGLTKQRLHNKWPVGAMFFIFLSALFASGILAYISFYKIDSMCIWCMSLYGTNFILFILGLSLTIVNKLKPWSGLIIDTKELLKRPKILIVYTVIFVGILGALELMIPPYWQHLGWKEIPEMPTGITKGGAHWVGNEKALVTIVEFSDYECPHCRRAHRNMRALVAKHPDSTRLIHKHWPMDNTCNINIKNMFHQRACEFAKASECASEQHEFWPMSDALFSIQNTQRAKNIDINKIAIQLGLSRPEFNDCMNSNKVMSGIKKNVSEGTARGVNGTPTFFIAAKAYPGGFTEDVLIKAINKAKNLKPKK